VSFYEIGTAELFDLFISDSNSDSVFFVAILGKDGNDLPEIQLSILLNSNGLRLSILTILLLDCFRFQVKSCYVLQLIYILVILFL